MNVRQWLRKGFAPGGILRYIVVGGFNTVTGMGLAMAILYLLERSAPAHVFGLKTTTPRLTMTASVVSTPLNITIAYLNYKFFVFRTKGNYLREWLKAFGVYGVSTLIGLVALGALTRGIEIVLRGAAPLGKGTPGYIAMFLMTGVTTVISYFGHKKVTFGGSPGHDEEMAVEEAFGIDVSTKLDEQESASKAL